MGKRLGKEARRSRSRYTDILIALSHTSRSRIFIACTMTRGPDYIFTRIDRERKGQARKKICVGYTGNISVVA